MSLRDDESEIRALVHTWMAATRVGDVEAVLGLMTDDAVFLVPGRAPMLRDEFIAASRAQSALGAPAIDAESDIQEIQIHGDWAFLWSRLRVVVTPRDHAPIARSGHTLTLFKREQGRWKLARDANLLVSEVPKKQG